MNSRKLITNTVLRSTLAITLISVLMIMAIACEDYSEKIQDSNEAARQEGSVASSEKSTRKSTFDLRTGDCYNDQKLTNSEGESVEIDRVEVVPCSTPHDFEVIEMILVDKPSGAPYPGESYFMDVWDEECPLEATFFIFPTRNSWAIDDRVLICLVE